MDSARQSEHIRHTACLLEHVETILDHFGRQGLTCGDARRVLALVAQRLIEVEAGARLDARP